MRSREEPGERPLIGQAVSGMEVAGAWSAASVQNVGRRVPIQSPPRKGGGGRERTERLKP